MDRMRLGLWSTEHRRTAPIINIEVFPTSVRMEKGKLQVGRKSERADESSACTFSYLNITLL